MVRLKGRGLSIKTNSTKYFNSKVVRLKAIASIHHKAICLVFQFQSGAVKSKRHWSVDCHFHLFQFQSGAVKSLYNGNTKPSFKDFNSKVVRLKVFKTFILIVTYLQFQFQSGAVKSCQ